MLSPSISVPDPLARALAQKARTNGPGGIEGRTAGAGDGWRVVDVVCTSGPGDRPFEERQPAASVSLVLAGTFTYRSERGASLMSAGSVLLGNAGHAYECSHEHGEGDRCLSFQFDDDLFDRIAEDAGARTSRFTRDRLPPMRPLALVSARAASADGGGMALEEVAVALAGAVLRQAGDAPCEPSPATRRDVDRVARALRRIEASSGEPLPLGELARIAGLGRYHFLRTFKRVTGITPHQWLLRTRLRDAARRLVATRDPVTEIALDVGFEDLSNFIRSFRSEFGMSPRRYRAAG